MNNLIVGAFACLAFAGCGIDNNKGRHPETSDQSKMAGALQKESSKAVRHFWFDYNHEPNPGKRVWVQVDDSNWTEVYPNGIPSRYKAKELVVVGGLRGTAVEKISGDPQQSLTLNDGSFQVFIPDKDNERLILSFRHFENGAWTEWKPLALINPIE